jgi:hypothetical protein
MTVSCIGTINIFVVFYYSAVSSVNDSVLFQCFYPITHPELNRAKNRKIHVCTCGFLNKWQSITFHPENQKRAPANTKFYS